MRALPKPLVFLAAAALCLHAQQTTYHERYRPQVHFSPAKNWTNDPNGLVYANGEYHLFFQYNPFGDQWGHMSWGHAVSRDLLHWQELPVAIPEQGDEMVFTGSVVVDEKNTSSLCAAGKPCMVAVYTGHHTRRDAGKESTLQNQNLAWSNDNGRTWTRYKGNPVLDLQMADFRDPSVFRDEEHARWVMAVALPKERKVALFGSPDLKHWTRLSDFGPAGATSGDWECPDLLQVPAEKGSGTMWAMKVGLNPGALQGGSGEQYFLGSFDGTRFTPSTKPGAHGWTNYGKDDYCAISFNHLPRGQQPVLLGWMSNWQYASKLPTPPWHGQMSLPRRLSYIEDTAGLALRQQPFTEPLRTHAAVILSATELEREAPFELSLRFNPHAKGTTGLRLYSDDAHYTEIAFDNTKHEFYTDRTHSSPEIAATFPAKTSIALAPSRDNDLRLIVDTSSIEAFAQHGTLPMTTLVYPASTKTRIVFFATEGKPAVNGEIWTLRSIWQK